MATAGAAVTGNKSVQDGVVAVSRGLVALMGQLPCAWVGFYSCPALGARLFHLGGLRSCLQGLLRHRPGASSFIVCEGRSEDSSISSWLLMNLQLTPAPTTKEVTWSHSVSTHFTHSVIRGAECVD
jgi:hypothetical protein